MKFDFIRAEKARFPIAVLCDVLGGRFVWA